MLQTKIDKHDLHQSDAPAPFAAESLLSITNRSDIVMERGNGMYMYDTAGKAYLDFISGWAVNSLGHSPAALQQALIEQSGTLVHSSPAFYNKPLLQYAAELTSAAGLDKVFFASSGAEANESAVKLARKHGEVNLNGAYEIISLSNSFHGRTLAMMSATGKSHWKTLFEPKVPGFKHVPINDIDALFAAISNQTCAIMLELVQGEGGVHQVSEAYLYAVRKACDMYGMLLIIDEVQTGMGRTGKLFAHQHYGITPDVLTLGKGIGAGFPLSAMLTKEQYDLFTPGDQGGTYCGSPLAAAVGLAVLNEIITRDLAGNAEQQGRYLIMRLKELSLTTSLSNVRGLGLLLAFDVPEGSAAPLVNYCMRQGLLLNAPNSSTIRLMPALIVSKQDIDEMLAILKLALYELNLA